jgi:hypothetical protein
MTEERRPSNLADSMHVAARIWYIRGDGTMLWTAMFPLIGPYTAHIEWVEKPPEMPDD